MSNNFRLSDVSKKIVFLFLSFVIIFNSINVFAVEEELDVEAKASLIVENNSGRILYEDNANKKNYPASVTKILTAIIVLENCELDDTAVVTNSAISNIPSGYVLAPLFVGEEMKIKDLLYALMLKSANDAAYVLAEHVGGSVDGFSDMMNKKAEELGCKNSHFVNPNGIHNENHYTTAYDMYLISKYAMENEDFEKIVSTYQYTLPATNKYRNNDRVMKNTNIFVNPNSKYYDKNIKGIKTGTTTQAGNCLITDIKKDDFDVITVVLGAETSDSKFSEISKMIKYAFDNFTFSEFRKKDDVITSIKVEKATKETENLNLLISDDIKVINNVKTNLDEIEPEIVLNDNIVAPISKGTELGMVKYTVDGIEYSAKLVAENDVELKTYYIEIIAGITVVAVIVIIIGIMKRRYKS